MTYSKIYLTRQEFDQIKLSLNSAEYWHYTEYEDHSSAEFWANLSGLHGVEDQLRIFDRSNNIVSILAYCSRYPKI